ncbi:porin [Larsenimonas rhizosphaerae]|uniref:Porin n=1 Tax=Larsenimonas rhizosphaerae TaxID=2944682 RepID=A0AA41ZIF4_9GAMM|nr:porin [Larsenimonas rhizosphaerae]MCX2524789.1 porin [Larsenimonas rhizosphaerae]
MKKTLLATAIAGALGMAASGAQAATVYNQDGSKLDLYGNVQLGLRSIKGTDSEGDGTIDTESDLFDNGSTFGVKGEHVLDNGLTAYFRAEFEFNADNQKGYYAAGGSNATQSGLSKGDQAYVGITGNFGDFRVGSWDALFNDWIQDPMANDEYFGHTGALQDVGGTQYESDKFTYTSPIWSGLQFAVGTQYYGDKDSFSSSFNNAQSANANLGGGNFSLDEGNSASLFGGLRYTMGGWTLAAVYDNLDNFEFTPGNGDDARDYGDLYGANVAYNIDTLLISFKYSRLDADWNDNADVDRYGIGFRYGYGMGDIYASYQFVDAEAQAVATLDSYGYDGANQSDETYNEYLLGGTYNLSNQMYVWLEGGYYDREDNIGNGVATGVAYSF